MEVIIELLFQLVFKFVLEVFGEVIGGIVEYVASYDFGNFLARNLPIPTLLSGEVVTLDIQNYKGGNS